MKKQLLFPAQFIVRVFLVAVVVNTAVSSAQILHDKDYLFPDLLQTVFVMLTTGLLLFAGVCILLFIVTLLGGTGREKNFWLLMIIGLPLIIIAYVEFNNLFIKYTTQTNAIAAIGAFALMVSLASQYQFFHKDEYVQYNVSI